MINRYLGSLILKCDDTSNIMMHDWWMAITASCFGRCIFLPESTIKYRQHASNAIGVRRIYDLRYLIGKIFRHNNMRLQLINSSKQAEKFLKVYYNFLTDRQKNLLSAYSNIYNKGKIKRLYIFCRYRICMHSLARKVGQFIYG